jgi:transcriptional regulator with XRE-family HTH domain
MADPTWFAGRLRELRVQAGLTRQELAERAGLSEGGVRDLEQGHRRPSWETVLALCSALGVDPNAFAQAPAPSEKPKRGRPPKATREGRAATAPGQGQETAEKPGGKKGRRSGG